MPRFFVLILCMSLLLSACNKSADPGASGSASNDPALASSDPSQDPAAETPASDASSAEEAFSESGGTTETLELSAESAHIQFVGNHTGDDPNPRTGHFEEFTGTLSWDPEAEKLIEIEVEIATPSLTTSIGNLTNHLRSADFFDVNEHPTLTFQSTDIGSEGPGTFQVTGNLTMLGNTQEITFPVQADFSSGEPKLTSEFSIQRSEFGMTYGMDRVEDEVFLTITVHGGVE